MGHHSDPSSPVFINSRSPNTIADGELLHILKKQELASMSTEAALRKLERRVRTLERSSSFHMMPGHYSCVYVSPIYDEKNGSIMYRTHVVEDGDFGGQSRLFDRDDEKDAEIKQLKSEVQRQDLETRRLKAEMRRMRSAEFEDEKSTISDKHVDKVNTVGSTISNSRPQSHHHKSQHVQTDLNSSFASSDTSATESLNSPAYIVFEGGSVSGSYCEISKRISSGPSRSMDKKLRAGNKECSLAPIIVPDLEGCEVSPDCSSSNFMVRQMISSLLSTMQTSVENLTNNIKMQEPTDSDSFKIDCGAIDDELFILKRTLNKFEEMCQECGYESFHCDFRKDPADADRLGKLQSTIDGLLQQLAQAEFKLMTLQSSCTEKDRKMEDLESRIHSVLEEREALMVEKYEFTTVIREMHKEADEQRHRIEELLSINEELLEISQAEETKLGTFQEMKDRLIQQVAQYEENCFTFESLLQEKDKELQDLSRRVKAGQVAADSMIFEKFELLKKVQVMQMEADEHKGRINELITINQELLELAQGKENQLNLAHKEMQQLEAHCKGASEKKIAIGEEDQKDGLEVKGLESSKDVPVSIVTTT